MSAAASAVTAAWRSLWFHEGTARNLAIARIIVAAHSLWILLSRDYAAVSGLPDFWVTVPTSLRWRYLLFEGHPGVEQALQWIAVAALAAALFGILPRISALVAGILLYHLAPMETVIWTSAADARGLTFAPVALVLLAVSRSGDALTLLPKPTRAHRPGRSWEYGWPLRLIQLLFCQMYLFAAYGKLVHSGLDWGSAENIRRWFICLNLDDKIAVFERPGLWIAEHPFLCGSIGVVALLFEWGAILAWLRRGWGVWLIPIALLFHGAILVTLNVHVGEAWLVVLFADWDRICARFLAPAFRSAPSP